jgi:hypothetical protein
MTCLGEPWYCSIIRDYKWLSYENLMELNSLPLKLIIIQM